MIQNKLDIILLITFMIKIIELVKIGQYCLIIPSASVNGTAYFNIKSRTLLVEWTFDDKNFFTSTKSTTKFTNKRIKSNTTIRLNKDTDDLSIRQSETDIITTLINDETSSSELQTTLSDIPETTTLPNTIFSDINETTLLIIIDDNFLFKSKSLLHNC